MTKTLRQQTVVVTGSAIVGTPEDAALPVDVITAGDLRLEGNPSLTELVQQLGVSSGVDGQSNQFASNGLEGTANVNLRGLGPGRTLVLLNGRRQVFSPRAIGEQAQLFVDTNSLPRAAVGRVEVLKDGA
ncbi:MAG: TonB-dependent receptor plug domain-containing protein, partial [Henriciella sp.]|nr:TonB-dependent receptor plug domain-containing protein [Henriciella sp.]